MFYLTSKFHDDSVNTFAFIGGGGVEASPQAQELRKKLGGIGLKHWWFDALMY